MKKLLLLLLLCPMAAMAQKWHPGSITLNDGTTKEGFVQIPVKHSQEEVSFKTEKKSKEQDYKIDDVKEFTITNEDMKTEKYVPLKLARLTMSNEFKPAKEKSWTRIEREGEINILSAKYNSASIKGYMYYIQKPGEDFAKYFAVFYQEFGVKSEFKSMQGVLSLIFKDTCPNLAESITIDGLKARGIGVVGEKFEEVCDKQE